MITPGADSPKLCTTCNQTGITRQFHFMSDDKKYQRFVVYDTHFPAIETKEHMLAMQRMNNFLQSSCDLFEQILPQVTKLKPPQGKIVGVDFETVQPTACEFRSDFILIIHTKYMDESDIFRIGPVKLASASVDDLVQQAQNLFAPIESLSKN